MPEDVRPEEVRKMLGVALGWLRVSRNCKIPLSDHKMDEDPAFTEDLEALENFHASLIENLRDS